MFLESPNSHPIQKGSIEVICGSMFSGKTEELLRRLKRAKYAKLNIKIFKPKIDNRYDKEKVVSHDANPGSSMTLRSAPGERSASNFSGNSSRPTTLVTRVTAVIRSLASISITN